MGYSFIIGEAVIEVERTDGKYTESVSDEYATVSAVEVTIEGAPSFGEPTDGTNQRRPSYGSWHDFLRMAGLTKAFLDEDGRRLRGGHPGFIPVTPALKAAVDYSYTHFQMAYPDVVATYKTGRDQDAAMCRLEWLKFWIDWSLENCKQPVMANT